MKMCMRTAPTSIDDMLSCLLPGQRRKAVSNEYSTCVTVRPVVTVTAHSVHDVVGDDEAVSISIYPTTVVDFQYLCRIMSVQTR